MKGIEGIALKYLAIIIASALILSAFVQIAGMIAGNGTADSANSTLGFLIARSLGVQP
jgi:electron transfer flavoprotein alpha/beta subunit